MTAVSAVVPTRNRSGELDRCLSALSAELGGSADAEIIVVDDASRPLEAQRNAALCRQYRAVYLLLNRRRGPAVARNAGMARAVGDWIAFIDDDVAVQPGWGAMLRKVVAAVGDEIAGIEGRIEPSGEGVWDREVRNLNGGLFLSAHIIYRAALLRQAGGFDERFEREGPFCEDHELAARMLRRGAIPFEPRLIATHLPRTVALGRYIGDSFNRIRRLLDAEYYFFAAQPAHYHRFRHARTFWGTYAAIAVKNAATCLRRRSPRQLAAHPGQALALIVSSILEQACAWLLLPRLARRSRRPQPAPPEIDMERTRSLWNAAAPLSVSDFTLRWRPMRRALFLLLRGSIYDARPLLRRLATGNAAQLYLRVDDVFLSQADAVGALCATLRTRRLPFLAAVTGADMQSSRAEAMLRLLISSGAAVALHGFAHCGRYGPYDSECLQMRYPDLSKRVREAMEAGAACGAAPCAFVPPFNAIDWEQVRFLARYFPVICAGPESARFNGRLFGPIAVGENSWYFPSVHPYYGRAAAMLKPRRLAAIRSTPGIACITVHCPQEAADGCASLGRLLDAIGPLLRPWSDLTRFANAKAAP